MCSPTRPNPGGGGETCAETGINIFFGKVWHTYKESLLLKSPREPACCMYNGYTYPWFWFFRAVQFEAFLCVMMVNLPVDDMWIKLLWPLVWFDDLSKILFGSMRILETTLNAQMCSIMLFFFHVYGTVSVFESPIFISN